MSGRPGKGSKIRRVMLVIFAALFCVSLYQVTTQLLAARREQQVFAGLAAEVDANRQANRRGTAVTAAPGAAEAETAAPGATEAPGSDAPVPDDAAVPDNTAEPSTPAVPDNTAEPTASVEPVITRMPAPEPTEEPPMLADYEPLYRRNHDLFAWLEIEDTDVSFPVMHTPRQPEYYLHRTFERKDAFSGVPFMDAACDVNCGNYLVYGHHMRNGTVFASLVNYADPDYWRAHPVIRFDTMYEYGDWDVLAAFYSRVYGPEEEGFRYYYYADLREPEVFAEYLAQVREAALYDTGVEARYGDRLLTLSTCEYSTQDGRFVVVARRRQP